MVVIFQILFPTLICLSIFFCPETPRWYIQHDNMDKAREALRSVRDSEEEIERELLEIYEAIEYEKQTVGSGSLKPIWNDKSVRWRFCMHPLSRRWLYYT